MPATIHHKTFEATGSGTVYEHMGQLLGTTIRDEVDALRITKSGVPTANYVELARLLHLRPDAVGSATTMRRRLEQLEKAKGRNQKHQAKARGAKPSANVRIDSSAKVDVPVLNEAESEKAVRFARVVAEATLLFGSRESALTWLSTPRDFLHDDSEIAPLTLAETDSGARLVESMMKRTAYGMF